MLQILKTKNPDLELNASYLERLQSIPHGVFAAEIEQLVHSNEVTATALLEAGTSHGGDFVHLADNLDEILGLVDSVADSSAAAVESASKIPSQPTLVYTEIERLLSKEMELYTHLDAIQELVQVPELAQACADSGLYTSAHDMYSFTQRLSARYPKSSVAAKINQDTRQVMLGMRASLLGVVRNSPKLQILIKTLGLLRKLDPFKSGGTKQLALQRLFAASRLEFLRSQTRLLSALAASNPALYLRRYTEQFREHVGTTLTAFTTVFGPSQYAAQFARQCVKDLAVAINSYYPLVEQDQQRTLLQLTYCSYSLGRVGVEFWPLLATNLDTKEWVEAYTTQQVLSQAAIEREKH